jgi:hypothetical protein
MKEPPDKFHDYYKCVKVPLKHVVKHYDINQPKINDLVIKAHKIVIHTLQFMKLYLIYHYKLNNELPIIDKQFINCCMKIICVEKSSGRPPKKQIKELKDKLSLFFNKYYKPTMQNEELDYTHMNTILDYLTIDILTMYENNIKEHFVEYLERYVNVIWKKKYLSNKIRNIKKTKEARNYSINQLNNQLRKIKYDVLNIENTNYKSKTFYHNWINTQKKVILPDRKFNKENVYYDIQCNPMDYLPCMIYMMKEIEKEELTIYNVFSLRSDIIPKHIRIDTTTLVHTLLTKKYGNKSNYLFKGNLKRNEDKIWKFFFRTERQCFTKKDYSFHHMIETDGISCSILLLRKDLVGKRFRTLTNNSKELYIDSLDNYEMLKNKTIVGVDPGKCDIIYCVNGDTKEAQKFRYSQDQRRKETKAKKYAKIILELKQQKINNNTIIVYETELSKYNRKTLNFNKFIEYITKKNEINKLIIDFYNSFIFRKLKLNGYLNRKRTEQKMVNRFQSQFGNPEDTIICFGDYEQRKHMKYKEPIKGRAIRTLFKKNGFKTYLVDEFRTSCKCSKCEGGDCNKFMIRENPKPYKHNLGLIHGLIACKKCSNVWNRDCNGATNIYKIAESHINKNIRPSYLCRGNLSGVLDDTSNSKFTRSEMGKPC